MSTNTDSVCCQDIQKPDSIVTLDGPDENKFQRSLKPGQGETILKIVAEEAQRSLNFILTLAMGYTKSNFIDPTEPILNALRGASYMGFEISFLYRSYEHCIRFGMG